MRFEPPHCPNRACRHHGRPAARGRFYTFKGSYPRRGDDRVGRYRCRSCGRHFSEQTFRDDYRQKKPEINDVVRDLKRRGYSARATARLLGLNRKTVMRRHRWLERQRVEADLRELGRERRG